MGLDIKRLGAAAQKQALAKLVDQKSVKQAKYHNQKASRTMPNGELRTFDSLKEARCLHSLTESSATLLSGTKQLGQPTPTLPPTSTGRRWKIVLFAGSTRLLHSKGIGQRKKLLICQGNLIPIFQAPLRFALDAESQSYREPGRSERKFEAIMADEKVIDLTDVDFLLSPDCRTCQEPTKRVTGKTFDLEGHGMVGVMYGCDNYRCKECKDRKCSYLLAITRM